MSETNGLPADLERSLIFVNPVAYADLDAWHATAALLRREDPVHRVEMPGFDPFFAVTRHADIVEIERNHEKFFNTVESVLGPVGPRGRFLASSSDLKPLIPLDGAQPTA